jgi:hypothetical protein
MRLRDTISINGAPWKLKTVENEVGGYFDSSGEGGQGEICIGTEYTSPHAFLRILVHEIVEATLTMDKRRFSDEDEYLVFIFDHEYLTTSLPTRIIESLVSCGALDVPARYTVGSKVNKKRRGGKVKKVPAGK